MGVRLPLLVLGLLAGAGGVAAAQGPQQPNAATVAIVAGDRQGGWLDASGTVAKFNAPAGIALDGSGNLLVADMQSHRIRRMTPDFQVTTLAGSGEGNSEDGTGTEASFNAPAAVDVGPDGDVYVADFQNGQLRKVKSDGGETTNVTRGQFYARPRGVAVDRHGKVYVAEADAGWVRKVDPTTRRRTVVTTGLTEPWGVAVGPDGSVYVTDYGKQRIRRVSRTGRTHHTFAGTGNYGVRDGMPGYATFGRPAAVHVDDDGYAWVADVGTHRIRVVSPEGVVATVAGGNQGFEDGAARSARFDNPRGITTGPDGTVYVSDRANNAIRIISGVDKELLTVPPPVGTTRRGALERGIPVTCGGNDRGRCSLRIRYAGRTIATRTVRLDSPGRRRIYVRIPADARRSVRTAERTEFEVSGTFRASAGPRRLPTYTVVAR